MDIETCDGFAMDCHIALFFNLDEMFTPREEALEKITKRLDDMKILLGEEICNPIAIMCTHGGKQWSEHAKIHFKNVQEDGVNMLQGLCPFIICLSDNRMHSGKFVNPITRLPQVKCYSLK